MCTNIGFPSKSKNHPLISARTMDWVTDFSTGIYFIPRGQSFPDLKQPEEIHWKNSLAFIAAKNSGVKYPVIYDGLNESGLSAASLSLFCSIYPEPKNNVPILANYNVVSYVLGTCKNIQEAKAALSKLIIFNPGNDSSRALHYIISDLSGSHLIIEFIDGKMHTFTTSMGVLTNDPPYDWHLKNLSLYEQLSLVNKRNTLCDEEVTGSGQLGIPGDPTSQSRFVRAAFLRKTAFQPKDTQQSIGNARQIIQSLSVPNGTTYLRKYKGVYDWTLWSVIRDHTNLSYYFYTDFNSQLYGVHLKQLDYNASKQTQINIEQPDWYKNVTKRLI